VGVAARVAGYVPEVPHTVVIFAPSPAACGALNVVRRGLGTGGPSAVMTLAERVELADWKDS
jgi:hypothetical protein